MAVDPTKTYDGRPCKHCGGTLRWRSSRECVPCCRKRSRKSHAECVCSECGAVYRRHASQQATCSPKCGRGRKLRLDRERLAPARNRRHAELDARDCSECGAKMVGRHANARTCSSECGVRRDWRVEQERRRRDPEHAAQVLKKKRADQLQYIESRSKDPAWVTHERERKYLEELTRKTARARPQVEQQLLEIQAERRRLEEVISNGR